MQKDSADPLDGWSMTEIQDFRKLSAFTMPDNDIYGHLYFYLQDLLGKFCTSTRPALFVFNAVCIFVTLIFDTIVVAALECVAFDMSLCLPSPSWMITIGPVAPACAPRLLRSTAADKACLLTALGRAALTFVLSTILASDEAVGATASADNGLSGETGRATPAFIGDRDALSGG